MARILIQTVLLLGIALAAGFIHSRVVTVQPTVREITEPPSQAATKPVPPVETPRHETPAPTAPAAPTASTGSAPATAATNSKPSVPDEGFTFITVQQAKEIYDKNDAVFVDARTFDEYKEGHVPNSMHMDKKYFDGAAGPQKAKELKGQAVVIYCHGAECTDSQAVAQRFISLKYQIGPIRIIKDGFPGWQTAGYPVDKGGEVGW